MNVEIEIFFFKNSELFYCSSFFLFSSKLNSFFFGKFKQPKRSGKIQDESAVVKQLVKVEKVEHLPFVITILQAIGRAKNYKMLVPH